MRISAVSCCADRPCKRRPSVNAATRIFLLGLSLALCSCATTTLRTEQQRIGIATDVYLELPSAGDLNESFDATQVIAAEYADDSYSFEAHIEARPGRITIVGIGALGGALFSIAYDGKELVASGAKDAQVVNAEYVLADVLLTHWDIDWLNHRLNGASITVSDSGTDRVVMRGSDEIIHISFETTDPWGGTAIMNHLERQYVLQITTAEFAPR